MTDDLDGVALALVADGKGILAADETIPTLTKRFDARDSIHRQEPVHLPRNAFYRRHRRLHQRRHPAGQTIRQKGSDGTPLVKALSRQGVLPGIKVAAGAKPGPKPWRITFSYGRALQDHALETSHGRDENLEAVRQALYQRARCNGAASLGRYTDQIEATPVGVGIRREWRDD